MDSRSEVEFISTKRIPFNPFLRTIQYTTRYNHDIRCLAFYNFLLGSCHTSPKCTGFRFVSPNASANADIARRAMLPASIRVFAPSILCTDSTSIFPHEPKGQIRCLSVHSLRADCAFIRYFKRMICMPFTTPLQSKPANVGDFSFNHTKNCRASYILQRNSEHSRGSSEATRTCLRIGSYGVAIGPHCVANLYKGELQ